MVRANNLLAECHGNTVLAEICGFKPFHEPMNSSIAANFIKCNPDLLRIAITDEDKTKPQHFSKFSETVEQGELYSIRKIPGTKHFAIFLLPAVEMFTWAAAEQAKVEPGKYNFGNFKYYHKTVKGRGVERNKDIRNFWNNIKQGKPNDLAKIARWLQNNGIPILSFLIFKCLIAIIPTINSRPSSFQNAHFSIGYSHNQSILCFTIRLIFISPANS